MTPTTDELLDKESELKIAAYDVLLEVLKTAPADIIPPILSKASIALQALNELGKPPVFYDGRLVRAEDVMNVRSNHK